VDRGLSKPMASFLILPLVNVNVRLEPPLLFEFIILIWSSYHVYYQPCMRPAHFETEF